MLAGPGAGFDDAVLFQRTLQYKAAGMSETHISQQISWYQKLNTISGKNIDDAAAEQEIRDSFAQLSDDEKQAINWNEKRLEKELPTLLKPWWRYAMAYDPVATLQQVKCPVLALIGEKDMQVPARENLVETERALQSGGNRNFMVKEMPGLNH